MASGTPHKKTNHAAHDPDEHYESANSVAVVNGSKRPDPNYDQGEARHQPEGNEPLPTIRIHTFVTSHVTRQSLQGR